MRFGTNPGIAPEKPYRPAGQDLAGGPRSMGRDPLDEGGSLRCTRGPPGSIAGRPLVERRGSRGGPPRLGWSGGNQRSPPTKPVRAPAWRLERGLRPPRLGTPGNSEIIRGRCAERTFGRGHAILPSSVLECVFSNPSLGD